MRHKRQTRAACDIVGTSKSAVLIDYIHTVASGKYIDTRSEQDFFRLAAQQGVLATEANRILEQAVTESGASRERTLTDQFAVIVDVSIRDRMLDRKEEANLFAWAEHQDLRRDVAERIIGERCDWADAGRQSTNTKPFNESRMKFLGIAVSLLLVVGILSALYIRSIPRTVASKAAEVYYAKAKQSLQRNSLLIPVEDSAYHWMWMIEKAAPEHPRLAEVRSSVRRAYMSEAERLRTDDPSAAIRYLELASAIRPGADVEEMLRSTRWALPTSKGTTNVRLR